MRITPAFRRSFLAVTAALLLARAPAHGQSLLVDLFGDILEGLRVQAGIPALAAVIVGTDSILWERAYGQQDLEQAVAARPDTPFHADAVTQLFTASLVLRCIEQGQLSLDDRVGRFKPDSPEPNATIRQLLSHTSGPSGDLVFAYRPERLDPLRLAVRACTGDSYRETLANLLHSLAMIDSVPGPDVIRLVPPAEGIPEPWEVEQYTRALQRLATPYAVDERGRALRSQYSVATLTPWSGLLSTVRDLARFDLALRHGVLLRAETLIAAWRAPQGADGRPLPHALGWFAQVSAGEVVVWQFGVSVDASSALIVTLPGRGLTLILMANSDRLVKPFELAAGDLTVSPFGKLFLNLFQR